MGPITVLLPTVANSTIGAGTRNVRCPSGRRNIASPSLMYCQAMASSCRSRAGASSAWTSGRLIRCARTPSTPLTRLFQRSLSASTPLPNRCVGMKSDTCWPSDPVCASDSSSVRVNRSICALPIGLTFQSTVVGFRTTPLDVAPGFGAWHSSVVSEGNPAMATVSRHDAFIFRKGARHQRPETGCC